MQLEDSRIQTQTVERSLPALARQTIKERLPGIRTLVKFMIVGAFGYAVYQFTLFVAYDSPVLWFLPAKDTSVDLGLFTHSDVRLLIVTLAAAELAVIAVFGAHTNWTFRERPVVQRPVWSRFLMFNAKAAVSTEGILTVVVNVLVLKFNFYHFAAVPAGVLAAFAWNWLWDSQFIFRRVAEGHEAR